MGVFIDEYQEKVKNVMHWHLEGKTRKEIAYVSGYSYDSVCDILCKLNLGVHNKRYSR